jgi:hypothetical protein
VQAVLAQITLYHNLAILENFDRTLPAPQSDLHATLRKTVRWSFDFFTLGDDAHEHDLVRELLDHLRQCLLELECAFLASQYRGQHLVTKTSSSTSSEYTLRDINKAIGTSGLESLAGKLKGESATMYERLGAGSAKEAA